MNSRLKDDAGTHELRLCLPDETVTQELQTAVEQLAQLGLTNEDQAFLLAELYIDYGQTAKAIEQLAVLANAESQAETVPEKKNAVRNLLKETEFERKVSKEKLKGLLGEVQVLRSHSSCGKCRTAGGDGRWIWVPPTWLCAGC